MGPYVVPPAAQTLPRRPLREQIGGPQTLDLAPLHCDIRGIAVGHYGSLGRGVFGCATLVLALLALACVWTIAKRSGGVTAGRGDERS